MGENKNTYIIRLEMENGQQVSATLEQVGVGGEKSLKRIEDAGKKTGNVIEMVTGRALGGLRGQIIALAGSAVSGAFIAKTLQMARNSIDLADAIGEVSERLGLTTKEYQSYAYAAKLAGIDQDQYSAAMEKFNKYVGSAINGNKEARAELQALGVDSDKVKNGQLSLGQAFLIVSDNLGKYSTKQEQATVLAQLFGKEMGSKFATLLGEGSAAISAAADEAERLGLVIDEDLIKKAKEAGDQIDTLAKLIQANFTAGMLDGAVTGIEDFSKVATDPAVADGVRELGRLMGELARITLDVAAGAGLIAKYIRDSVTNFDDLESVNNRVAELESETSKPSDGRGGGAGKTKQLNAARARRDELLAEFMAKQNTAASGGDGTNSTTKPSTAPAGNGETRTAEEILAAQERTKESIKLAEKEREKVDAVVESLVFKGQQLSRNSLEQEIYNNLQQAGVSLMSEEGREIQQRTTDLYNMEKAQERNRRQTELWQEGITALGTKFDDLRGLAMQTLTEIANALIQVGTGTGQGSGLGGLLVSGFSSFASSFSGGSSIANPNLPGASYILSGRASGGPVDRNTDYIVGERGPEILSMGSQSGSITPNHKLGSSFVIEHIDARGTSQDVVDNMMNQIRELKGTVTRIDRGFESRAQTAVANKRNRSQEYLRG